MQQYKSYYEKVKAEGNKARTELREAIKSDNSYEVIRLVEHLASNNLDVIDITDENGLIDRKKIYTVSYTMVKNLSKFNVEKFIFVPMKMLTTYGAIMYAVGYTIQKGNKIKLPYEHFNVWGKIDTDSFKKGDWCILPHDALY